MATDREKASLVVDITPYCDDDLMTECYLAMELDDEYNSGQSCFPVGGDAYVRVYGNISYSFKTTFGTPRNDSYGVGLTISQEYVDFTNWTASTIYPVNSIKSYEWIGKSLGTIHKARGSNNLTADKSKHEGYGVAQITYTTKYDRWIVSAANEADVIAYAHGSGNCEDTKVSITLQFREDCAGAQDNTVTLTFKDYISGAVIPGASVWVNGLYRGVTDSNGQIYLGRMDSGEHQVRATHPSYSPTQADLLANDYFVVSGS